MSDRFTLKVPEGVRYEALICLLQSATANGAASSVAAERAANRNGFANVKPADCRAAVEFLRIAIANEIARLAGAPAAVFGGSSVLIDRSE